MEPNLKEIIKNRIDLTGYIAKYSPVDGRGFASCPIHKETQASLKVYDNKSWYCFGCQKGGDLIDFVMIMDGITFTEAMEKLAYEAGVDLKKYKPTGSRFNKVNEVLRLNAEIKKWEDIIKLTNEQILLACSIMNSELKVLYNTPWQDVDHKHYTKIHIKEQQWSDYNDQANKVLNLMRKELEKWQTKLAEVKKES